MRENYTLTYSESVNGWPSFYSYFPDFALGMNNIYILLKVEIFIGIIPMKQETIIMELIMTLQ